MPGNRDLTLLVGDNPFHGISHLSQERGRVRGDNVLLPEYAAKLVMTAVDNGATGFMFSVSEKTLSILRLIRQNEEIGKLKLYALVPYAYEYVRLANQLGGISGLANKVAKQIALSGSIQALAIGLKGVVQMNPEAIMRAYIAYEISRIRSAIGKKASLDTILLHEVVTDMALALNLDWVFKAYMDFAVKTGIRPGLETRNFSYLVRKLEEWNINIKDIVLAAPFNKLGFLMNPSRVACEKALEGLPKPNVVAISILAAGYLKPSEAADYVFGLPNVKGIVVGVSKDHHARETFRFLRAKFQSA